MKADEYLEAVVKAAFERELEGSENIARTLPFFAASFAVAVPLYGYIAISLPGLEFRPLSLILHALLAFGLICAVMILWNLFLMVRLREYRIPPKETEQIDWMQALRAHYEERGLTAATVDKKVTHDLRDRMLLEYATGAEHNREANIPKLRARASGVVFFAAMLAIAFAMIGIIFISQRLPQRPRQDSANVAVQTDAKHAAQTRRRAAAAAEVANPAIRAEIPLGPGGQHGAEAGSQMTEADEPDGNRTPPPTPAQPASQPPAPPRHQLLKKNDQGGERR